jgi:hypothetical protein
MFNSGTKQTSKMRRSMSASGPKRTFCDCGLESAFGCKADIDQPLLIDLDLCVHVLVLRAPLIRP